MPSLISRAVPTFLRVTRANRDYADADRARALIEERSLRPQSFGVPKRLRADVEVAAGRMKGWPVYTITPRNHEPQGAVVYVHGGGWVSEIVVEHWRLAAQIAAEAQTSVVVPIYPLVPFGTAELVIPQVAELIRDCAAEHGPTCVAGDSAGGQIALSAALALRDEDGTALPLTVLISPALDGTYANPAIPDAALLDPWLPGDGGEIFTDLWAGGLDRRDPRVSPVLAELAGLGPILMFSGTFDMLNPDARLLAEKGPAAGVAVDYHEAEGLVHVWPLTHTPEGRAARRLIAAQLRSALRAA